MTASAGFPELAIAFTVGCTVAVASLVAAEWSSRSGQKKVSKTIASVCFLGVASCFFTRAPHAEYYWVLAGLVLGAAGDVALLFSGQAAFLAGLSAFLAGHIAYVVAFALLVSPTEWFGISAIAVGAFGAGALAWFYPHLGSMRVPVVFYIAVLCVMVVAALSLPGRVPGGATFALGAALFAVSDLAVARERFVADTFTNKAWGLPTYYAGQLCMAWASSLSGPA
jgi:uncharacterized membrane protein YhhN